MNIIIRLTSNYSITVHANFFVTNFLIKIFHYSFLFVKNTGHACPNLHGLQAQISSLQSHTSRVNSGTIGANSYDGKDSDILSLYKESNFESIVTKD